MINYKESKSLREFRNRYNKAINNPGIVGVQLQDLDLTTDLEDYLIEEGLYIYATRVVHVLHKNKMLKQIELKESLKIYSRICKNCNDPLKAGAEDFNLCVECGLLEA